VCVLNLGALIARVETKILSILYISGSCLPIANTAVHKYLPEIASPLLSD
jgi:hypothetical protein